MLPGTVKATYAATIRRTWLSWFSVGMALWLLACASFQFHPRTPWGTQCPTAEIQLVKVVLHDCCGRVVGYEMRTPQPGDKAFVQCRCAENKSAAQAIAWMPPKLEPFAAPSPIFEFPSALEIPRTEYVQVWQTCSVSTEPPVPPPLFA